MRWTRGLYAALLLCLAPASLVLAQAPKAKKSTARTTKKKTVPPATAEEVRVLREALAAQSQVIQELTSKVERLTAAQQQAASAAEHARTAAGQAQATASQAQSAASQAQQASRETQAGIAQVKAASETQKKELEQKVSKVGAQMGWNGEHFYIKSADGNFRLEPYGYLQADYRSFSGAGTVIPPDTFIIRRARFGFQANLGKRYQIVVLGEFGGTPPTTTPTARDFFLNVNLRPELQFRIGQFKEPFSQEELTSALYLDFVERSLVTNLIPSRSPGLQISGQFLKGAIQYQGGIFNGKGLLSTNNTSTPEGVARLRFYPWRNASNEWLKGFGFGGAATYGRSLTGSSFRGVVPEGTFPPFFASETVNGKVLRANGEFTWTKGPAAIRAEYDQTNQRRDNLGPLGTNLPGVVAKGYYFQASYLLTGETRPENAQPKPRHEFISKDGYGIGAWELKFRYSNLQMEDGTVQVGTKRNRAEEFSTGINWYPNSLVRFILDFNVERFKNPIAQPSPKPTLAPQTFLSVLQRIQFRF